jgi:hypothetical protein
MLSKGVERKEKDREEPLTYYTGPQIGGPIASSVRVRVGKEGEGRSP